MSALAKYDAACAALDAAVTADEVMAVRFSAQAIEAVAKVAKNLDFEIKGARLRTRAEAKLGDMLRDAEAKGLLHAGRPAKSDNGSRAEPLSRVKLQEIGVDKKLSSHAQKLSGIGAQAVAAMLDRMEAESRKRGRIANDVVLDALRTRNRESRRQLARELSDCAALQPCGRKFPVVYADPAWHRKAGVGNRAYENHYTTMTWADILAMPVAQRVLPDAWLFLWIPRAHLLALHPTEIDTPLGRTTVKLPLAWAVAQAWGFDTYSTCAVWTKTDDEHPDDHGTGLIFWDQDELLLVFKRGRGLAMPSGVERVGSNYRARAGKHSAKPDYYRDIINRMCGAVPVLELFAREDDQHPLPPNFFTWGNQSRNTAEKPEPADTGEVHDSPPVAPPSPPRFKSPLDDSDPFEIPPMFQRGHKDNEWMHKR